MRERSDGGALTRREVLAAAAGAGALAVLGPQTAARAASGGAVDFASLPDGDGWPGWHTTGVANLRCASGAGLLEAGSDIFPNDPRPVAFALDSRFRDGEVRALVDRGGRGAGVVVRRAGPAAFYAAVYDSELRRLVLLRRDERELVEMGAAPAPLGLAPLTLTISASGAAPTRLTATLADAAGSGAQVDATDGTPALQRAGDPGVLATAQTFLADLENAYAPFGGARLGFFGTQEGTTLAGSPPGQAYEQAVRERSTAAFRQISFATDEPLGATSPSVVAATTTLPARRAARLAVATDVPAAVTIEISRTPHFRRSRRVRVGRTGEFDALVAAVGELPPGRRVWWRARVRRAGRTSVSPARSFRVLPRPGDHAAVRLAVGACATHFGPNFDHIAARRPDVFVWQGDLNYPDTHGLLAQTTPGYAGIWRNFLRNPRLEPILAQSHFVPQRDDHDFGVQDANAQVSRPWGFAPWDALMSNKGHHRFSAGLVDVFVLDERTAKSDPTLPDTPEKTLLGLRQRDWLLRRLERSSAPFKVICSPCTLHYGDNARDGNWNAGFLAERQLLLDHIAARVGGRTIFLSGDAHDTMVYDLDGVFEARACPLDIPDPRDHPGVQAGMIGGRGVVYSDTASHFSLVDVEAQSGKAVLSLTLVREDGSEPYRKRFEEPLPPPRPAGRRRRRARRRRSSRPPRYTG
jgi:hypothetical protein